MSQCLNNEYAERGTVSCALQGADIPALGPDWFTNRNLWDLLQAYRDSGQLGPSELAGWLKDQKLIDRLTPAFVLDVWRFAPSAGQAGYYLESLRKARLLRRQQQFGADVLKRVSDSTNPDELAAEMEREVLALRDDLNGSCDGVPSLREAAMQVIADLETRVLARQRGILPGIASGLGDLDQITNGFQGGRVYVIGARPGMGKTSLVRQIMLSAAKTTSVYFLNLEMSAAQTFEALLATEGKVDFGRMQAGTLTERDFQQISRSTDRILQLPIHVDDRFLTVPNIESTVRRMVRRHKIGLFCLDYIQLLPAASSEEERNTLLRIGNASNMLVRIAKEHNIPVIALAQLNREAQNIDARELSSRHIRDCGQIEQDAWFIGLLGDTKAEDAETNAKPRRVDMMGREIIDDTQPSTDNAMRGIGLAIVKNRSGRPNGFVQLMFQGEHLIFHNAA